MKNLKDILESVKLKSQGSIALDAMVKGVAIDSRKVEDGFLFIAYKGVALDGHKFIESAISKGAKYIVLENENYISDSDVQFILVDDARKISSLMAANFYDHPSASLKVVGITGTNGKTTTASLLYDLFGSAFFKERGYKTGLISTIENKYGETIIPAKLTTPDAVSLQALFAEMRDENVSHVFMEVSSHALDQGRVNSIQFDVAVFTNITHDHLDYHNTFAAYIKAKQQLFDNLDKDANVLINIDDRNGEVIAQHSKANKYTYALKKPAKFKGKVISNSVSGLQMTIEAKEIFLRLIGFFNAYNALAAYGVGVILGEDEDELLTALSTLKSAEGRMDVLQNDKVNYKAIVDYAHTPDALEKVLQTLSDLKKTDSKIITVVGCGGDRDKTKRPKMAKIGTRFSDIVLLTSDNPRSENPEEIIKEMFEGVEENVESQVIKITDRKEAIKMACMLAKDDDIILVAGKGHEKYQEVNGEKFPFDDKEIISAFMH